MKSKKSEPYRRPPCPHKNQSPTKRMSGFCFMLKDKFFNLIEARLVKIVNPPGKVSQSTRICLDSVARTYSNIFVHFYDLDRQNLVINWTWKFRGYYPWFRFVKTRLYSGPFHLFGDEGKLSIKHAVNRQDKRKNAQDDVLKEDWALFSNRRKNCV